MHRQLAYVARARGGITVAEIGALIERRRTGCAVLGLTGALVHTGDHVFELLEGAPEPVTRIVASLAVEPALRETRIVLDHAVPLRWYRTWRAGTVPSGMLQDRLARIDANAPLHDASRVAEVKRLLAALGER